MSQRSSWLALSLAALAACSGGGSAAPPNQVVGDQEPRIESTQTAGVADALAAALLASAGRGQDLPLQPVAAGLDAELADTVAEIALDHLRGVGYGAGAGPALSGSRRVQRLALAAGAPADGNGDGSNRDETLQAEVSRLATAAGAGALTGLAQPIVPWAEARADLAAPVDAAGLADPRTWRTVAGPGRIVLLRDVAVAMSARIRAASSLLAERRGTLFGATGDDGLLGLLLLSQCLAAEEELVAVLSTDGSLLGGFDDPHEYDPAAGRRWFPTEVAVPLLDDGTLAYQPRDLASDLATQSLVLDAAAELSWFSAEDNPSASIRAAFTGPFAPPPPQNPPQPRLNWQNDIRAIIHGSCSGCHLGFPTGGFLCNTYASTLNGSPHTRALGHTMVIPGNHAASLLHRILTTPPPGITRMPAGSSISAVNLQRIDTWIDQGALEFPEVVPPPPSPGEDLAALCFRNIVAMHFDAALGALHHRHEGDQASGIATAEATGRALSALAHLRAVAPALAYGGLTITTVLQQAADFARQHLVDPTGRCVADVALATLATGRPADLADQVALTRGLLDAAISLGSAPLRAAAAQAVTLLLAQFRDAVNGWFRTDPQHQFARYDPLLLADLLTVLRTASAVPIDGAAGAHQRLLARLQPALAHASFRGIGQLPTPGAAGGEFGRLPLLAGAIRVGPEADAAPALAAITWTRHVRPLLLGKCGDCHFGGAAQGGYRCDTLALLALPGGQNGSTTLLVPGDPEGSFFWRKLTDRQPASGAQMPLQRTLLDDRARAMLRQWIASGASPR